jgi:hypothetical protein
MQMLDHCFGEHQVTWAIECNFSCVTHSLRSNLDSVEFYV